MDPTMTELNQKIGNSFTESMVSVFSMLTGRDFTVSAKESCSLDHAGVAALYSGQVIFVKAHYTKGMTGTLLFALPLKEGTMLVDLMLGGEGAPSEELAGDSRDALAETFNQILGSANQTLSDMAGETLSIATVEIFSAPGGDPKGLDELLGSAPFLDLPLSTTQDTLSTTIHLLAPDLLVQQMKRKLGLGEATPEPAAAPAAPLHQAVSSPGTTPMAAGAVAPPATYQPPTDTGNLDLLLDIELPIMVRMGQTEMQLGELLKLTPGSILELHRAADAPVELLVNNKIIAKGEVVVVDGNFAFRITEIESTANRLRSLA